MRSVNSNFSPNLLVIVSLSIFLFFSSTIEASEFTMSCKVEDQVHNVIGEDGKLHRRENMHNYKEGDTLTLSLYMPSPFPWGFVVRLYDVFQQEDIFFDRVPLSYDMEPVKEGAWSYKPDGGKYDMDTSGIRFNYFGPNRLELRSGDGLMRQWHFSLSPKKSEGSLGIYREYFYGFTGQPASSLTSLDCRPITKGGDKAFLRELSKRQGAMKESAEELKALRERNPELSNYQIETKERHALD